jgi:hypothetical protein
MQSYIKMQLEILLFIQSYRWTVKNINYFKISTRVLFCTNQKFINLWICLLHWYSYQQKSNYWVHATTTFTWKDDYFNLKLKTITITLTNLKSHQITSFNFLSNTEKLWKMVHTNTRNEAWATVDSTYKFLLKWNTDIICEKQNKSAKHYLQY